VATVIPPPTGEVLYRCDVTASSYDVTLPAPASSPPWQMTFKRVGEPGKARLLGPVDSDSSYTLEFDNEFVVLVSDGVKFNVVA
jgi:hypothetical protein